MLIQIKDVYKIYGEGLESEVRALDGVSLSIDRGEFVPYFKGYISTIFATSHHLGTIQEKQ